DEGIEIDAMGDGELCVAHRPNRLEALRREAELLTDLTGLRHVTWSRDELAERAYRGPEAHGALYIPAGFGLHPLKYLRGLARAAMARGVAINGYSYVTQWSKEGDRHRLITAAGSLRAKRVLVATNGFTRDGLHPAIEGRLLPVLSNIITTRPLSDEERADQGWRTEIPIVDSRNLLFYFRILKDGRFLLGARGGTDASPAGARRMHQWMIRRIGTMFPAWRKLEISHFWRGLICMAPGLTPHIGRLEDDPSVFYSLAYHGSGVAMASWSGRAIAREIGGRSGCPPLPVVVTRPLRRFPLPGLRLWYLRAAYAGYMLRDEYL
ncbi:MAG: FAD-binding oxidoreductase, partial [Gammaproteobacteria bacterium]|nr:FAD-binding oxidoreductase [Gammaproteobacteria bacterium]